ncbi:hypothetical protein GEMRC1_007794 [Eukaryota sp. GEM-RC1]
MKSIEKLLPVDDILYLRTKADRALAVQIQKEKLSILQEEQEEILNSLEISESITDTLGLADVPPTYIHTRVQIVFNSITLNLLNEHDQSLLNLNLISMVSGLSMRTGSMSFMTKLQNLTVQAPQNTECYQTIVAKDPGIKSSKQLFKFHLDLTPQDKPGVDMSVSCSLQPLSIIADLPTLLTLASQFSPPSQADIVIVGEAFYSAFEDIKSRTIAGVQSAVDNRSALEVELNLASPIIHVPYRLYDTSFVDYDAMDGLKLVLGKLAVTIDPKVESRNSLVSGVAAAYDSIILGFSNMSTSLVKYKEEFTLFQGLGINGSVKANISKQDIFNPLSIIDLNMTPIEITIKEEVIYDILSLLTVIQQSITPDSPPPPQSPAPTYSVDISHDEATVLYTSSSEEDHGQEASVTTTTSLVLEQALSTINFSFDGIRVEFWTDRPILDFDLSHVTATTIIRRKDLAFSASLSSISIINKSDHNHSPRTLLSVTGTLPSLAPVHASKTEFKSEGNHALVASGVQYQVGHPSYNEDEENGPLSMALTAKMANVHVYFDPPLILSYIGELNRINANVSKLLEPLAGDPAAAELTTEEESADEQVVAAPSEATTSIKPKMSINFDLGKFELVLERFHSDSSSVDHLFYSTIEVSSLSVHVLMASELLHVASTLNSISVSNPLSNCYPYMLKSLVQESDHILSFKMWLYQDLKKSIVDVDFSNIRALFMGPFLAALLDYTNRLSCEVNKYLGTGVQPESTSAQPEPKSESNQSHEMVIPNINLVISNFHVVLPRELESPDCVDVEIGNFQLKTNDYSPFKQEDFKYFPESPVALTHNNYNFLHLSLSKFDITIASSVFKQADLSVTVALASPQIESGSLMAVGADIQLGSGTDQGLVMILDQSDLMIGMSALNYNLSYLSSAQSGCEEGQLPSESVEAQSNPTENTELSSSSNAPSSFISAKFNFEIKKWTIALEQGTQGNSLCKFVLDDMSVFGKYHNYTEGGDVMATTFRLQSISILDCRSIAFPCYRKVLSVQDYSSDSSAFVLTSELEDKDMNVSINLAGFYVVAVPDFLVDCMLFATDALSSMAAQTQTPSVEEVEDLVGVGHVSSDQSDPNQSQTITTPFIESVTISVKGRLDMILPDCQHLSSTRDTQSITSAAALSLVPTATIKLGLNPLSVKVIFSLDSLDALIFELHSNNDNAIPTHLSCLLNRSSPTEGVIRTLMTGIYLFSCTEYSYVDHETKITSTVNFQPILLNITYVDIRLSMFIVNSFLSCLADHQSRLPQQSESDSQAITSDSNQTSDSTPSFMTIDFSFTLPSLSLVLLDDSSSSVGLPLMRCSLKDVSTQVVMKNNSKNVVLEFIFDSWLWNDSVNNYDTFIEPFGLASSVCIVSETSNSSTIMASFQIQKGVEITVSAEALKTLSSIIPLMMSTRVLSERVLTSSMPQDFAPVWIVNYTGWPLTVRSHVPTDEVGGVTSTIGDAITTIIDHNCRRGLSVNSTTPIELSLNSLVISTFEYADSDRYCVISTSFGEVLVSVETRNRSVFVTVSGSTSVRNRTDRDFYLFPTSKTRLLCKRNDTCHFPVLENQQTWNLSLIGDDYDLSQSLPITTSSIAHCLRASDLSPESFSGPFTDYFNVCCTHSYAIETSEKGNFINLLPLVSLSNALPYPLTVELSHKPEEYCGPKSCISLRLEPLSRHAIYHFDPSQSLYSAVQVETSVLGCSHLHCIFGPKKKKTSLDYLPLPYTQSDATDGAGVGCDTVLLYETSVLEHLACNTSQNSKFSPTTVTFWVPFSFPIIPLIFLPSSRQTLSSRRPRCFQLDLLPFPSYSLLLLWLKL